MIKLLSKITVVILTSLYFFPFICSYFPFMNTKMAMGGLGLILTAIVCARKGRAELDKTLLIISLFAAIVSAIGFAAITYNSATDYTYTTYIVSMWVWISAAFVVVSFIRAIHGSCSVFHICNYLIAVCAAQCIIALMVDNDSSVKSFVDSLVVGEGFMGTNESRMYGIGASLDVAGMKFAAVLIMISVLVYKVGKTRLRKYQPLYLAAFLLISIVGSMIGRTTYIGILFSFCYWLYAYREYIKATFNTMLFKSAAFMFFITILTSVYFYKASPSFEKNVRFAFEGFFSLVEKGYWETNSNNRLKSMIVYPKTTKTWIIGDGYFNNPYSSNPYYIGEGIGTFYMNTDIGYLRFIFYFGVIGMIAFMIYFCKVCHLCVLKFSDFKSLFILVLITNFVIWFKVASDLFVVFAPFLLISQKENDEYNQRIQLIP